MIIIKILLLLLAYLFGSIPFGYVIGKLKGVDIREHGSKNIGATNTGRVLGKKYAILVFLLDATKGFLLTFLFRFGIIPEEYMLFSPALYGLLAILGHAFSIFLKFKGGKAVATSGGFIAGYCPWLLLVLLISFLITTHFSKMVSLGSLVSTLVALLIVVILTIIGIDPILNLNVDIYFLIFSIVAVLIIFVKHRQNMIRIAKKSESKVNW